MTKNLEHSSKVLKITASLLNSWAYIYTCNLEYQQDAYESFYKTLQRIKEPPTEAMLKGIKFEKKCYDNQVPMISNIIENGAYQVYAEKTLMVDNYEVKVLGYLDVLKQGVIYDIKRTMQYDLQKYYHAYQHHTYLYLIDEADSFVYLVAQGYSDDSINIYTEVYDRADSIPMDIIIKNFYDYLKQNDLFNVYVQNWSIEK
jgi:hypothetical protein